MTVGAGRRVRVADPLEVGQAVQIEVGLDVETPVRDDAGDDVKVKAVGRQVELEEPMDCAVLGRLVVVGPPDRIEARSSPRAVQERERTQLQRRGQRSLLEPGRPVAARMISAPKIGHGYSSKLILVKWTQGRRRKR